VHLCLPPRQVRCLQENIEDPSMSTECKAETTRDMNRMGSDFRLNFRLVRAGLGALMVLNWVWTSANPLVVVLVVAATELSRHELIARLICCCALQDRACRADISKLCNFECVTNGTPCGGTVLQCLQEKQDNITSTACQEEVFYYELMEVSDYRNDIILAENCRLDVEAYCRDVEPGNGRVHICLRYNRDKISPRCAAEEDKLQVLPLVGLMRWCSGGGGQQVRNCCHTLLQHSRAFLPRTLRRSNFGGRLLCCETGLPAFCTASQLLEFQNVKLRPRLNKLCSEEQAVFCKVRVNVSWSMQLVASVNQSHGDDASYVFMHPCMQVSFAWLTMYKAHLILPY
jgi:hypothetical protein